MFFRNRMHAGRLLANRLARYARDPDVLVLALPRGGVVVGYPIAAALNVPLDVVIVRKLGVPEYPEFAMGAIASGGIRVLSAEVIEQLGIPEQAVEQTIAREELETTRREALYRGTAPAPQICGRTVILVDDGIATGSTMQAAVAAVRQQQPKRLVIAVPVAPPSACADLAGEVDEFICLQQPEMFFAIGEFYKDFLQVSDEEVQELLKRAADRSGRRTTAMEAQQLKHSA
jgi:putative phosphoribosyl transferase